MKRETICELRSEDEWDQAWKKARLPKTLNTNSLFGFCFDKLMKKHLQMGMKLLEIGCAGGKFLIYFKQKFDCDVFGIDYSPVGCKLAEKNLALTKTNGTIICDDIFECKGLEKESFDVVFSAGFIEHFDRTEEVIARHIDFLKPGGKVIIGLPTMLGFHGFIFRVFNRELFYKHKQLTKKMVEECFSNLGIQIVESSYIGVIQLESGGKPKYIQPLFYVLNKIFYVILRTRNMFFESQYVSPYIVVIGEKPISV